MKRLIEKLTRYLVEKQPDVKREILNDYLDKKVISVSVNELNDFRDGEQIHFKDVVLYRSLISSCTIETAGVIPLDGRSILTGCIIKGANVGVSIDMRNR